jgi:hypothetical protein
VTAILRRLIFGFIAVAAMASAAAVVVVAAAFALYALVREPLGAAGAAAVVVLAAALLIGLLGLIMALLARSPKPKPGRKPDQTPLDRIIEMARERPIVSVGAILGAAVVAMRNPAVLALVVKAVLDSTSKTTGKPKKPTRP